MNSNKKIRVLMVCMGNICRSPLAHGLFESRVKQAGLTEQIEVDSAGTHAYHIGKQPDPRSQQTALRHGLDLNDQRGRQVADSDFVEFDYILAMDSDNLAGLLARCPAEHVAKLQLFMAFAPDHPLREVPDPYYGGDGGFEQVYEMVDAAAAGLLQTIRQGL